MTDYPRDMIGFGPEPPHADWPGSARIAISFVINHEEGAESNILHGDAQSERYLCDVGPVEAVPVVGGRDLNIESMFEYGARAGFWRLRRIFTKAQVPVTVYGVGMALERTPEAAAAMVEADWEVAGHGYRWIDYRDVSEEVERAHLTQCIDAIATTTGARPVGWFSGRRSVNTRRLVVKEGGFLYDSDGYSDDLPYWNTDHGRPHLVVPYSRNNNDLRFGTGGVYTASDFFAYLRDSFDTLYAEGAEHPKMMTIGLHNRLIGRPGRAGAILRFLDHAQAHDRVWFARRREIAEHWHARHPYEASAPQ